MTSDLQDRRKQDAQCRETEAKQDSSAGLKLPKRWCNDWYQFWYGQLLEASAVTKTLAWNWTNKKCRPRR